MDDEANDQKRPQRDLTHVIGRTDGKTFALEGKVRGEEISFTAGGREYRGTMNGKRLELR